MLIQDSLPILMPITLQHLQTLLCHVKEMFAVSGDEGMDILQSHHFAHRTTILSNTMSHYFKVVNFFEKFLKFFLLLLPFSGLFIYICRYKLKFQHFRIGLRELNSLSFSFSKEVFALPLFWRAIVFLI